MPSRIKLRPRSTPPTPGPDSETLFLDEADGVLKSIDSEGVVTAVEGAGGGAAEPGTVVVTPPLEVDVIAALEGANAPDGSNPLATIADLTIAEVLSNGDTVAPAQTINVPDGAAFGIQGLTTPSPAISWLADGGIVIGSGDTSLLLAADGSVLFTNANGGTFQVDTDGTVRITGTAGSGVEVSPDGTIDLNGIVTINPDFTYSLNGAQFIEATAAGLFLHLPTADPAVTGALWDDAGFVKVSA